MDSTLIKSEIESFDNDNIESISSLFRINHNNNNFLVSVHHFNPIIYNKIYHENEKLNVMIRSNWNELLIFKDNDKIKLNTIKLSNVRLKKPNNGDKIFFNNMKDSEKYIGNYFSELGRIISYPRIVYYVIENKDKLINGSYSGMPVFDSNKKLVGIICKNYNDKILVLPVLYLLKTLTKKDNSIYFFLKEYSNLTKIKNYKIEEIKNDKYIFFPAFGKIPIDAYLLIEGDKDKLLDVYIKKNKTKLEFENIFNELEISNDLNLIQIGEYYKVNICLIKLLFALNRRDIVSMIMKKFVKNEKIGLLKIKSKKNKLKFTLINP